MDQWLARVYIVQHLSTGQESFSLSLLTWMRLLVPTQPSHLLLCMTSFLPHSEGMTSSVSRFGEKEVERLLDLLQAYSGT